MKIRRATEADVPEMLALHREAVQRTAAGFYALEIIEQWSPAPTEARILDFQGRIASGEEAVFVAVEGKTILGFGSIIPDQNELRAVYVHPDHGRKGVGGVLLSALEKLAMESGVKELQMHASLNAEAFYAQNGFESLEHGEHILRTGLKMPCVKMRKSLNV